MPIPAVQTPFHPTASARQGKQLYRKQVLPVGTVEHPEHGDLEFTPDMIGEMVETFDAGAMTQVPFVLCDENNRHTDDPERFRGEVKGVEAKDDGLYALVETTERGAALLEDNPTQPVSVRMLRPTSGKFAGRLVLGHVAATLDEVAKGMHPWEKIEASAELDLTDLSDGTLTLPGTVPETDLKPAALSDEDQGFLRKLLDRFKTAEENDGGDKDKDADTDKDRSADDDADRILAELLDDDASEEEDDDADKDKDTDRDTDREPVLAALSAEDRKTLELANQRAESAENRANAALLTLGRTQLSNRFRDYLQAGVPPALLNAAKERLKGDETVIDLANEKPNAETAALFAVLDAAKGTLDFSEIGKSTADDDEAAAEQRRKDAEAAAEGWV